MYTTKKVKLVQEFTTAKNVRLRCALNYQNYVQNTAHPVYRNEDHLIQAVNTIRTV